MKTLERLFNAWIKLSFILWIAMLLFPSTAGASIKKALPENVLTVLLLPAFIGGVIFVLTLVQDALEKSIENDRRKIERQRDPWGKHWD